MTPDGNDDRIRIALIGGGPTALMALDRILAWAPSYRGAHVEITHWAPNAPGAGLHDPDQPDYLQLNTIVDQMNVFTGCSEHWIGGTDGPSFRAFLAASDDTSHHRGWDYVPRRQAGLYLTHAHQRIVAGTPDNVTLRIVPESVDNIVRTADRSAYCVKGDGGTFVFVDKIADCTGHTGRSSRRKRTGRVIENPYPMAEATAGIQPGDSVAIQGMGLAASDTIMALTIGRGGCFQAEAGQTRYVRSGSEPQIWIYSRSGLPFRARPFAPPGRKRHTPLVLTEAKIDALRDGVGGDRRLDYTEQIKPLLSVEIEIAYHLRQADLAVPGQAGVLRARLAGLCDLSDPSERRIRAELDRLQCAHGPFDPSFHFDTQVPAEGQAGNYPSWLIETLRQDLLEAERGLLQSPLKAALEVVRDVRSVLRYAVEFDGLTGPSHAEFFQRHAGHFNRLVGGPAPERNRELIALLEAGIVRVLDRPGGTIRTDQDQLILAHAAADLGCTQSVKIDWVIKARDPSSGIIATGSKTVAALHRAGLVSSVRAAPGLDGVRVDRLSRPIDRDGCPIDSLAFLGPVTEGARFYNHYIADTSGPCRLIDDADLIAKRFLGLPTDTSAATIVSAEDHAL